MPDTRAKEKDRIRQRLDRVGSVGMGSAFAANQKVSRGVNDEEAEEMAKEAQGAAKEAMSTEPEEKKEEEVPPPDKAELTEAEIRQATELNKILRSMSTQTPVDDKDPLRDVEWRKKLEAGLAPISVMDLMFKEYAEQTVELFSETNRLRVTFRSLRGDQYTLIERWVYSEIRARISPPLLRRLQFILTGACMIQTINGVVPKGIWPDTDAPIIEPTMETFADFFLTRIRWMLRMNPYLMEVLITNAQWFEQRVNRVLGNDLYLGQQIKKS
jgi:hypothetical protein